MSADGSVIIETKLDGKQAEKDLKRIDKEIKDLSASADEIAKKPKVIKFDANVSDVEKELYALGEEYDRLKKELGALSPGDTSPRAMEIYKGLDANEKRYAELLQKWSGRTVRISTSMNQIKQQSAEIEREIEEITAGMGKQEISSKQVEKSLEEAAAASNDLSENQRESTINTNKMAEASKRMESGVHRFSMRLREVIRSALVFTVISQGLASLREWLGKVIKSNDEATEAIARLKGALLTLAQPLVNVIIPAFTTFVNVLTRIIRAISSFVSWIFGTTAEASADAAESLYDEMEALEGVGEAAEKAEGSLASFDEINTINSESASSAGGSGSGLDKIEPVFGDFDTLEYKRKIDELTAYVSGALLAIGAILAFSGVNIPLGLTLMAAGAIGLVSVIAENWDAMDERLKAAISKVLISLGTAAFVIGAILTFSGANVPLGISLMIAGAASLAAAVALNWDTIPENIKNVVTEVLNILGISLLVIGAVLALSGANLPLGIGLMALGAASLAASIALNWDEVKNNVKDVITEILVYLGSSLLALGAIIALSGVSLPLGIKLMAIGAVSLASAAALNWESVVDAIRGPIGAIVAIISSILIVLGLILALSGVALPLGIALIAAGAVGLVSVSALNWNVILEKLKEAWGAIKNWWNTSVSKYVSLDYWKGIGADILNGLWEGLKSIWQSISNWVSEKVGWIADAFSGATKSIRSGSFGSSTSGSFGGRSAPRLSVEDIPALARGTVVPPNREFLARLGDNKQETEIVSPLSTMKQALLEALQEAGGVGGGTQQINLVVDGRTLAKVIVPQINRMTQQAGKPVLLI